MWPILMLPHLVGEASVPSVGSATALFCQQREPQGAAKCDTHTHTPPLPKGRPLVQDATSPAPSPA